MKKNYMNPTIVVVKLQHQHVICTSNYGVNRGLQNDEVNQAWTKENTGSSDSVWDEEW